MDVDIILNVFCGIVLYKIVRFLLSVFVGVATGFITGEWKKETAPVSFKEALKKKMAEQ